MKPFTNRKTAGRELAGAEVCDLLAQAANYFVP
jgi:hypothetical protein